MLNRQDKSAHKLLKSLTNAQRATCDLTAFFSLAVLFVLCLSFFTIFTEDIFARAGGAGGSSSSSSDSGGDSEVLIYLVIQIIRLLLMLPFPYNFISIAVIVIIALCVYKKGTESSPINNIPAPGSKPASSVDKILQKDPSFSKMDFIKKVETAFYKIQSSWAKKDISAARIFISDGVYQRFNTQFLMMNLIGQTNTISKIEINSIFIDSVEQDGDYDIIHAGIDAYIEESFRSSLNSLNQNIRENFREYWSFIRKRGAHKHNIYESDRCPNCDAVIDYSLGEISQCRYCNTLFNSGEYDWVLSEITQAQDYSIETKIGPKQRQFSDKIRKIASEYPDFSVQHIEDTASNAYLQLLAAQTLQQPERTRRFSGDAFYKKWTAETDSETQKGFQVAYNRLFLNAVTLAGFYESETAYTAAITIKRSYQRVSRTDSTVKIIDHAMMSDTKTILLQRNKSGDKAKGSLYAHMCPVCGAPVSDTAGTTCSYCNSTLNDPAHEWIVSGLFDGRDFTAYLQETGTTDGVSVKRDIYDEVYDVRDYAFNNILAVMGCDGNISEDEKNFALKTAKRFGYNAEKVSSMIDLAVSGKLAIRMPQDKKHISKIIKLMNKAAMADSDFSQTEKDFITSVSETYLS